MDLSELIDTHKGRRTYPELSRDCGGTPSGKRLQQLVKDPIKNFPDPPTMKALARGLRVPERAVVLAAAQSLGLEVRDTMPRLFQLLPTTANDLSEQQAAAIAHLVDAIVEDPRRGEAPTYDDPAESIEPTVAGVLAARAEHERTLKAVAEQGDPEDAEQVDEIARRARENQTKKK
ncbi:hypothetical protein [Nocardioides lijunqiniae]|uniref:hypothetical protein n=1 Tax=Nocardioides lijunqiniae TaxID=2760832 RepID=UPI00187896E3|nr:hypothetical protein [Nocardioides lijunqiniae]